MLIDPTTTPTVLASQSEIDGLEPHLPLITPTQTPTPEYICPVSGTAELNINTESGVSFNNSILDYLNSGGNSEALIPLLTEQDVEAYLSEVDFNGDAVNEFVLGATFDVEEYVTLSITTIYQCQNGKYETVFGKNWGYYHRRENLSEIIDLNNDNLPEVIIEYFWSGSACTYELLVVGWQPARGFVDYSPSYLELDFGCSGVITVSDLDGDNIQEIIIQGETVGHLASAPLREIIQTFRLIGPTYRLQGTEYLPTTVRVHILDDAQRALDAGDYELAIQFYEQAAHDTNLMNYPSNRIGRVEGYSLDSPEEYQRAFALFRLAVLQYHLENFNEVNATLNELEQTFPAETKGGEFTILTHLYINSREAGQPAVEACMEVTDYIEENYPELDAHIGEWGVNIASYNDETICPILN